LDQGQFVKSEKLSTQVESDFLRAIKITGKADDLVNEFSNSWDKFYIFNAQISFMQEGVQSPAIY